MSRNYSKLLGAICMMVLGATHAYPQSLDSLTTSDLAAFRTILAEKERKAFDKLPTPAAKREWVKIYWKRHDPTPTTAKNERLEEFWRRLQYARKWFSAPTPTGFDDRGKVYLRFGEPTQKYTQPIGDLQVRPNESWSYSGIIPGLVFDFVSRGTYYRIVDDLSQVLVTRSEPGPEMFNLINLYESRSYVDNYYDKIASELRRILSVDMSDYGQQQDPRNQNIGNLNLARQQLAEYVADLEKIKAQAPPAIYRHDYEKKPLAIAHSLARFQESNGQVRVEIYYGVPYNYLKFSPAGRYWATPLAGEIAIFDQNYARVATDSVHSRLVAPNRMATLRGAFISQFNFSLPPGAYHMALRIENEPANRLGILRADFTCPNFPPDQLAMSDLQLSPRIVVLNPGQAERGAEGANHHDRFTKHGLRIMPLPGLSIDKSRVLNVYFEIYNLKQDVRGRTKYELQYALKNFREKKSIMGKLFGKKKQLLSVTEQRQGTQQNPIEHIGIDLRQQPAGKFILEVSVHDLHRKEVVSSSVPIRIVAK